MRGEIVNRREILHQLTEGDLQPEMFLEDKARLSEEKRIKSQVEKGRRRIQYRRFQTTQPTHLFLQLRR